MTIPARKAVTISVAIERGGPQTGPLLLEGCCDNLDGAGLEIERSLFQPNEKGEAMLTILNTSGFTEKIPRGTVIGKAMDVQLIYQQTETEGDDRDTIFTGAIKQVKIQTQQESNGERKPFWIFWESLIYHRKKMLRWVNYLVIITMCLH